MLLLTEALIAFVLLIWGYYKYAFKYWNRKNIPFVPPRIPWGNYTNIFQRKVHFGHAVAQMYHQMKKEGHKYFGIYLFSSPCFIPIDPKYIRLILAKDYQFFHNRNFYYNEKDDPVSAHLLSLNGDKWKVLRSRLSPTFSTGKLRMLFNIFLECGKMLENSLEDCCQKHLPFNAKDIFSSFSTDIIVNCAFGLEVDRLRKKQFNYYTRIALDFNLVRSLVISMGAAFPEFCRKLGFRQISKSAGDFFIDIVRDTVSYREDTKTVRNDFLQLLINMKNEKSDGEFSIEEIAAQCFIFFLAGYETSATTMSFALFEIAANPPIYKRLVEEIHTVLAKFNNEITYEAIQEMTYLNQTVDETLRKYSPAYTVSRSCTKSYKFEDSGIVIDKGTLVLIPIRGLHLDPEFFPDPEKFDPDRFSPDNKQQIDKHTYLPFGEGPRKCIGRRFGYLETKIGLIIALRKYKFSVNSKTITPLQPNPKTLLFDALGGIWLNCEKI